MDTTDAFSIPYSAETTQVPATRSLAPLQAAHLPVGAPQARTVPPRGRGRERHLPHRHYAAYLLMRGARRRRLAAQRRARAWWASGLLLVLVGLSVVAGSVRAAAAYYQAQFPALTRLAQTIAARDSVR